MAIDLWLVTSPGVDHSLDPPVRPLVHRPFLCARTAQSSLSIADVRQHALEFLTQRQPYWFLGARTPLTLTWRPCARPAYRLFSASNCTLGATSSMARDVQLDTPAALQYALQRANEHAEIEETAGTAQLAIIVRGTWTIAEWRRHAVSARREARREGRRRGRGGWNTSSSSSHEAAPVLAPAPSPPMAAPPAASAAAAMEHTRGAHAGAAWEVLRACRLTQCAYRCPATLAYDKHLSKQPPLHLADLVLPAGAHVLLYGTSYLGQLGDAIVCAAASQGTLLGQRTFDVITSATDGTSSGSSRARAKEDDDSNVNGRTSRDDDDAPTASLASMNTTDRMRVLERERMHTAKYVCCDGAVGEVARSGTLVTYWFQEGVAPSSNGSSAAAAGTSSREGARRMGTRTSSLTLVINHALLQRGDARSLRLLESFARRGPARLLSSSSRRHRTPTTTSEGDIKRFTHIVYMQPHPACFFRGQKCVDLGASPSTTTTPIEPDATTATPGVTKPVPPQWRALCADETSTVCFHMYPWHSVTMLRVRPDGFTPHPKRVLVPSAILRRPCRMPGCASSVEGHQCLPGSPSIVSRDMVRAIAREHA